MFTGVSSVYTNPYSLPRHRYITSLSLVCPYLPPIARHVTFTPPFHTARVCRLVGYIGEVVGAPEAEGEGGVKGGLVIEEVGSDESG